MQSRHLACKVPPFLLEAWAEARIRRLSAFPSESAAIKALMLSGIIGKVDLGIAETIQSAPLHVQDKVHEAVRDAVALDADPIAAIARIMARHGLARSRHLPFPLELSECLLSLGDPQAPALGSVGRMQRSLTNTR